MAHDEKHPAQDGPGRDVPPTPGRARYVPSPWAAPGSEAAGATKSNPVSWAIEELQGDQDLPGPANGAGTPPGVDTGPGVAPASTPAGNREPLDSQSFSHRRPALRTERFPSPFAPPPSNGAEIHTRAGLTPPTEEYPNLAPVFVEATEPIEAAPAFEAVETPETAAVVPPAPARHSVEIPLEPPAPPPSRAGSSRLWLTAAVSLAFGLVGGLIAGTLRSGSSNSGKAIAPPAATPPAVSREDESRAKAIGSLSTRFRALSDQLESLGARVSRVETARSEPPSELADLRAEIGRLTATTSDLAPLSGELKRIDGRLTGVFTALRSLNDELAAVRTKADRAVLTATTAAAATPAAERPAATVAAVASPGPAPGPTPAAAPAIAPEETTPAAEEAKAFAQAMKLFKQNRFKDALGIFNRLELTSPDDARVWYFAALSHGFATGQWTGGTERLVEKGIERERAGTPDTVAIDAALNELTTAQGRDWLTEYRRRGASKPEAAAGPVTR